MSKIAEQIKHGEPLNDLWIADAHCHYGPYYGFYVPGDPSAKGMIRQMDRIGVNLACISTHAALSADVSLGNELMFQATERFPERLYGYVVVHPNWPDKAASDLARAEKCKNVIGVKLHPGGHQCNADDPRYEMALQWCSAHNRILLAHSWEGEGFAAPKRFVKWLEKYPTVPLILGHAGGADHAEVVREYPNAYAETCGTTGSKFWPEKLVEMHGEDKVVWGSDMPFHDERNEIGRIGLARLQDDVKAKVLGGNMARLLRGAGFEIGG